MTTASTRYRPEIDGLRALAVVAVIVNHFHKDLLPSGYLGVDIFFVISGFVITTSLGRHSALGFRDFLLGFYARRLRRILPALLIMVLVSSVAISLVDPSPGTSLITGITAIFGFSNIYLVLRLTDYFAASAELNIFLHTWSLGIEEQFYFLFPLLAWWCGFARGTPSGRRRLAGVLVPLMGLSLFLFLVIYPRSQPHAYFLISSRFWELASGCLLALRLPELAGRLPWSLPTLPLLAALVGTLFLPVEQAVLATLLCIAITSALIFSLVPGSIAFGLLSCRRVVWIGLLSYSLYLWHWPVLALSRWTIGIHPQTVPLQLLLVFSLAWLSYRFVERPLRHAHWPGARMGTILLCLLASVASSLGIVLLAKNWRNQLFLGQKNDLERNYAELSSASAPICNLFDDPAASTEFPQRCGGQGMPNKPTIYLLGDSQIQQFAPAVSAFASQRHFAFRGVWANACAFPALTGVKGNSKATSAACQEGQRTTQATIQSVVRAGDVVIIGSYLTAYFNSETQTTSGNLEQTREHYLQGLLTLAEALIAKGASVVIYLNGPRFDGLEGAVEGYCFPQWYKINPDPSCKISAATFILPRRVGFRTLFAWHDGVKSFLWDGIDVTTCPDVFCQAIHYKDEAHYRTYYANYLFAKFLRQHPSFPSAAPRSAFSASRFAKAP